MLAAAWLGRGFWGLLRGAGRRRPCGGARPLGSRAEAGGRRHGNGGAFCLAGGLRAALALREPRRPLRAPFWSPLCGEAGPRRAGSGGAAPPEPPRERSAAGRYAELVREPRERGRGC